MTATPKQLLSVAVMIAASPAAHAQHLSNAIAIAAVSPVVFVLLAGVLGWLERNLLSGLVHIGLILLWVVSFAVLSNIVTTDWLIWAPLVFYGIHCCWMMTRLVVLLFRRRATTRPRTP